MLLSSAALVLLLAQASPAPSPAPAATPEATPRPAPAGPVVVLDTSVGKIKLGLYRDKSPLSVDNFVKYVRAGHFDGTIFHRVIPNFMIQGGGFEPDMRQRTETLRPAIRNEAKNRLRNLRGTVAMARTNDPNSATAQFFINLKDNAFLDFGIQGAGYAVFGEVIEGMEVVDKIAATSTGSKAGMKDVPLTPIVINTVREVATPKAAPAPKPAATASPRP